MISNAVGLYIGGLLARVREGYRNCCRRGLVPANRN